MPPVLSAARGWGASRVHRIIDPGVGSPEATPRVNGSPLSRAVCRVVLGEEAEPPSSPEQAVASSRAPDPTRNPRLPIVEPVASAAGHFPFMSGV